MQVRVQAAACPRIAAAAAATSCLPQASACRPGLRRAGCKHGVCWQQLPPVAPWEVPAPKPVLILLPACVELLGELGLGLQVEVNQENATRVSALHLPSVTGAFGAKHVQAARDVQRPFIPPSVNSSKPAG